MPNRVLGSEAIVLNNKTDRNPYLNDDDIFGGGRGIA